MDIENTQAQMRKGILEYCILLIIAGKDSYVQDIINKLKDSKILVVEGTLYPLMTRLKNAGLLSYRWEESPQGPPRKYYSITEQGKQTLELLENSWRELTASIERLKTFSQQNSTEDLNGQAFCIDDDACAKLQVYIETLEKHYLTEADGKEIMADIESRIAELLQGFLQKAHKQVVSLPEIEQVIETMGTPEVIIDEDTQESTMPREEVKRKLYRDPEHRVLGGVASGLATYFDINIAWFRVAFIVLALFYGITVVIYIILWIAIPKAVTARQKLEMKGKKITVSNIEKNIRDTCKNVKDKI